MVSKLIEKYPSKHGWLCVVPGLGHLHMNQLKTLFKVLDYILLEPVGKKALHLTFPKAYQYFVEAKDIYKSYQVLKILLHGTTAEFCRQYVEWCYTEKCDITSHGFPNWLTSIENETFDLVGELIFNFVFSVQKLGVRCNNDKMISAGRYKFMPLFFAFHHPIYQDNEFYNLENIAGYPEKMKEILEDNMSFQVQN